MSPRLKQALELARNAAPEGTAVTSASIAFGLARQRDSVAARILEAHGVSPERLQAGLDRGGHQAG
ncbi:MAG: hypothetical protein QOE87_2849 [Gaiellales bacterium]|jgi:hypothetical protein|nr:hypothetical protein [Gaiellales bacterium]